MNIVKTPSPPSRRLRAEAAAWLAKLHGPERSPELESDFRGWVSAGAENARAFEYITEIWDSISPATTTGLPRTAHNTLSTVEETEAARAGGKVRRSGSGVRILLAACTCAAVAAVAILWIFSGEHYTTEIGEQRIITLADSSRLSLNSGTRVDVDFDKTQRRIFLKRGEAYFEVAKDSARPFIVTAGKQTVTALGTTFLVRYDPQITTVTLVEGKVTVAPVAAYTATYTLTPGQRLAIAATGSAALDTPKTETTAAWRRGEVILDNTPLAVAAARMNCYERRTVVIDDAQVAELPVSGIYKTGDSEGFAQAVAAVYNLQITLEGNEIRLHRK
jgi:Fe2+-dicitrate sensor, membrane component